MPLKRCDPPVVTEAGIQRPRPRAPLRRIASWEWRRLSRLPGGGRHLPGYIASQGRYVMGANARAKAPLPLTDTLPLEEPRLRGQGLPGSGENSFALSGLSFQSSASAGGSPLRVMFGHRVA